MGPIWQIQVPLSNTGPVWQILVPFGKYQSHSANTGPIRQKWVPSGKYRTLCQILVPFGKYWSNSANTSPSWQILGGIPWVVAPCHGPWAVAPEWQPQGMTYVRQPGKVIPETLGGGIFHTLPQQAEGLQTISLRELRLRWISRCFYNSGHLLHHK